ncbi:uncharacterized protein LOC62_07G008925 [Vanrija pseudolonga]|uniref:F-box domain-containing protein n=1 Tax=Vanrija pseudolonga TaxID=143232 RepID=A0AAF0YJ18_9TREE|nr:hypothetical protein LOC62_07G008925 [Vanrija pseudolonga]
MPVTIDHANFRHIFDNIVSHMPWDALLSLRRTSKAMKQLVDPITCRHIILDLTSRSTLDVRNPYTHGRIPCLEFAPYDRRTQARTLALVAQHTKIIDYWGHDAFLSGDGPYNVDHLLKADIEACLAGDKIVRTYMTSYRVFSRGAYWEAPYVGYNSVQGQRRTLALHVGMQRYHLTEEPFCLNAHPVVIFGLPVPAGEGVVLVKIIGTDSAPIPPPSAKIGLHPTNSNTIGGWVIPDLVHSRNHLAKVHITGVEGSDTPAALEILQSVCANVGAEVNNFFGNTLLVEEHQTQETSLRDIWGLDDMQWALLTTPLGTKFPCPETWNLK